MAAGVRVVNLTKSYLQSRGLFHKPLRHTVLSNVSLEIRSGECLALVGESGCGKSTAGRCILRLLEPDSGQVFVGGIEVTRLRPRALRACRPMMQMIFQNPALSLNPRQTAGACVSEPLLVHRRLRGGRLWQETERLFAQVGLEAALMHRRPAELSGGQMQRVAIARALAAQAKFIIADEPTSSLDAACRLQILQLLKKLQAARALSLLFITHDMRLLPGFAARVAVMHGGAIVECAPVDRLFHEPRHPQTRLLLAAAGGLTRRQVAGRPCQAPA